MQNRADFFVRKQRGQSMVELAISLMLILWLLAGAIDFGIGFFSYVAIRDAAQEGALYGSIEPTGNIEARVRNSSEAPVVLTDTTNVHVTITLPATVCAGNPLTVTVQYDFPITMAITAIFTGPTITLRASATSVILLPGCSP